MLAWRECVRAGEKKGAHGCCVRVVEEGDGSVVAASRVLGGRQEGGAGWRGVGVGVARAGERERV